VYARVTNIEGVPADLDAGIENFRAKVVPFAREHGAKGSILLVDRERGDAIGMTLWEDDELSEVEACALRPGADVTEARAVARYEVAIFDV